MRATPHTSEHAATRKPLRKKPSLTKPKTDRRSSRRGARTHREGKVAADDEDSLGRRRRVTGGGTHFYSLREFAKRLGVSELTLWRLRHKDPSFPTIYQISAGRKALKCAEADAWVESKAERRDDLAS
jgi:predicted DNA-binding transcriptional regulator AlpA